MPKLYRTARHTDYWVAYAPALGWVHFPAKPNGWEERQACRGLDPLDLREVPIRQAFNTGFLEWLNETSMPQVA